MTHVDLFSGIGGFALAAQWAGFKTVAFVEIEPYAQELIKQNFGAVADADCERRQQKCRGALGDEAAHEGRSTNGDYFASSHGESRRPRIFSDIRKFDGRRFAGATLLTGGFPCQPFSQAGKRRGKEDDRYLWPEMLRVIHEARPAWVLGENVAGIVTMELDRVLSDLEGEGYAVQSLIIPACAVDAKHRRDRVWIVGHAHENRRRTSGQSEKERASTGLFSDAGESFVVADAEGRTERAGLCEDEPTGQRRRRSSDGCGATICESELWRSQIEGGEVGGSDSPARWLPEPDVGLLADGLSAGLVQQGDFCQWPEEPQGVPRVATGVKNRVDQLKGLGNAIVAQVAYEIVREIARLENENKD